MAEQRNKQPPAKDPWTLGRHGVPMAPTLANQALPATELSQPAPLPDRSQEVRPADSSQGITEAQAIDLEPLASSVAETGNIRRTRGAANSPNARTGGPRITTPASATPVSVGRAPRRPEEWIVLLLLMLIILSGIAYRTPARQQAVAAGTMELLSTDIPEARTAPAPGPLVGQLDVSSTPSGVELFVDGERQGVTPAQLVLKAGPHEVTLVSPIGTVRRTVRVRPGQRTLLSEAIFNGSLVVSSAAETEVRIDGKAVDASDGHELVLAPGSYRLELLSPDDGAHTMHIVEVFPGRVTTFDAGLHGNDS